MKLSTKGKYGLFVAAELARRHLEAEPVSVCTLAETTGVTEKYLEQIIAMMKKDNIVVSTRGACGGYKLADSPESISVGRVLRAVEDNLEIVDCLHGQCSEQRSTCVTRNLWAKLYEQINAFLDGISLQQLTDANF